MEDVPSDAVLSWLANDWARGVNRRDAAMPLEPSTEAWGLCLRFQACPDDSVEILVNPVNPSSGAGCIVSVRRGEGGTAATMGRQVASLVAAAERDVAARLAHDLKANFPTAVACEIKLDPSSGEILGVSVPGEDNNFARSSGNSPGNTKSGNPMVDAEIVPPPSSAVELSGEDEPELPPELANLDPSRLSDESVEALGRTALKAQQANERRAKTSGAPNGDDDELTQDELDLFGLDSDLPPDFVAGVAEVAKAANMTAEEVSKVFARGSELAAAFSKDSDDLSSSSTSSSSSRGDGRGEMVSRRGVGALATSADDFEAVDDELVRLSVSLASANGLDGGLDLFSGPNQGGAGPAGALAESAAGVARKAAAVAAVSATQQEGQPMDGAGKSSSSSTSSGPGGGGVTSARLSFFRGPVEDPSTLAPSDAQALAQVSGSLALLVRELCRPGSSDLAPQILGSYREVVLSEWYPAAARRYLATLPPEDAEASGDGSSSGCGTGSSSGSGPPVVGGASSARAALTQINNYALTCAQELGDALAAAEHAQLEKVRQICDVAMEDMSKLPAAVAAMKPLLDQDLVAYLGYAIDKERELCRERGDDPDKAPTTWLQVLGLVRRGVYAELSKVIGS